MHLKHGNHDGSGNEQSLQDSWGTREASPEALDLGRVRSIDDLVRAMSRTAFTGRQLGEAADVLEAMVRDEDCFVVMTVAGAMSIAQQGLVIAELIDRGIVHTVVSSGELVESGSGESSHDNVLTGGNGGGLGHRDQDVEEVVTKVLDGWDHNEVMCSYKLNHAMGSQLAKRSGDGRGILKSAYEKGVPVFVPAFTDSKLGLNVALSNRLRESTGRHKIRFDPFEDLEHFAATLLRQKRLGILAIGGGVPDNWAQQFGPFIELRHRRLGENVPSKRYHYGVRICPESAYGVTPSGREVVSGNFVPEVEGGRFGEVLADATVGLPLIVAAVLERLDNKKKVAAAKGKKEKAAK